jgi:hypothetical protein
MFGRSLLPLVSPAPSPEPANWIPDRLFAPGTGMETRVCAVVPVGFAAYVRVLHPAYGPSPEEIPIQWRTVAEMADCTVHPETQWDSIVEAIHKAGRELSWQDPSLGRCPPEVLAPLRDILVHYTRTPDVVWFALWIGFTDVHSLIGRTTAPRIKLPGREYILLKGPLEAVGEIITSPYRDRSSPSLWWPDDRSWCVATEIDFRWTYVGATADCVEAIERDGRIEVLRTQPHHRGDVESDWPHKRGDRVSEL